MDFWDLTRLMFRRWYISCPMILVTFLMGGWVAMTVKPDYRATGQLQLVPPQVASDDAARLGKPRNPWVDLGQEAVGQAAAVIVTQPNVVESLKAQGYTDVYTVTLHDDFPIVVIEATGKSAEQATRTVQKLSELVSNEVLAQQRESQLSLPANQLITTRVLSNGETTERVTTALKRTLIVVVAGALLLTAGTTVAVDAWINRRRLRARPASAEGRPTRESKTRDHRSGEQPAWEHQTGREQFTRSEAGPLPVPVEVGAGQARGTLSNARQAAAPTAEKLDANGSSAIRPDGAISVAYRVASETEKAEPGSADVGPQDGAETGPPSRVPYFDADSTIVLPLTGVTRPSRHDKDGRRK